MHSAVLCFPFPVRLKKTQRRDGGGDGGGPDKEAGIKEGVKRYVGRGSRGLPQSRGRVGVELYCAHSAWKVIGALV